MSAVAILGCGFIGRIYGQVLTELGVRVAAVVDPVEAARAQLAASLGCRHYADLADMLAGEPDVTAVGVSSPTQFHHDLTMRALRAGKHVLCEKPLALQLDEVAEMVNEAERRGLKLAIGLKMRFESIFSEVKRLLDEGIVGRPLRAIISQHQPLPPQDWVRRYGIANELLIHGMDMASWLLECEPRGFEFANDGFRATTRISYGGDRDAVVTGAWVEGFPAVGGANDTVLQVIGERGHLIVCRPGSITINSDRQPRHIQLSQSTYEEPFRHEWAAFLGWTRGDDPGNLAIGRDALRVHELLQQLHGERKAQAA